MVGDTILIKDISINGNNGLDTASELSEMLTNNTINSLGIDASSRTIWVNGQPYGNAYVNIKNDTIEAPIGAEIFNDFENNVASGKYSHAEGYKTNATTDYSHAEGFDTTASGYNSHAEGAYSKSLGNYSHAEGYKTMTSGGRSHAEGDKTTAAGGFAHAEGYGDQNQSLFTITGAADTTTYNTSENHRLKVGQIVMYNNVYRRITSIPSENSFTVDNTFSKTALGGVNIQIVAGVAYGDYSHAEGNYTTASGSSSHAEGSNTIASGYISHAEGAGTEAIGYYSHTEGNNTRSLGNVAHAEGNDTIALGYDSHTEGNGDQIESSFTITDTDDSITYNTSTEHRLKVGQVVMYNNTYAQIISIPSGTSFIVDRRLSQDKLNGVKIHTVTGVAYGDDSHTEGAFTTTSGARSHAEGSETIAFGGASHAEGDETIAFGGASHAEGSSTIASGYNSHTEGHRTTALGEASHAEGDDTLALGYNSHAEGGGDQTKSLFTITSAVDDTTYNTSTEHRLKVGQVVMYNNVYAKITSIPSATSFTVNSTLSLDDSNGVNIYIVTGVAYGEVSHAEGFETTASGSYSHAEGFETTASGSYSHAEGENTMASGVGSHVEGENTVASGVGSHAEGENTVASGSYSHAEGYGYQTKSSFTITSTTEYITYKTSEPHELKVGQVVMYNNAYRKIVSIPTTTSFTVNNAFSKTTLNGVNIFIVTSVAYGDYSHTEGSCTTALGDESHAGGYNSIANGNSSFVHGNSVIANNDNEVAFGRFNNSSDNNIFSIGIGTDDEDRKNAVEVNDTGEMTINSHLTTGGAVNAKSGIQTTTINASSTANIEGATNIKGTVTVGTTEAPKDLTVNGNIESTGTITSDGLLTVNDESKLNGTTYINSKLYINGIGNYKETIDDFSEDLTTVLAVHEVTYEKLQELITEEKLIPGAIYRITNYVTTVDPNKDDLRSAYHYFDIIVRAKNKTTLFPEAHADYSSADSESVKYFKDRGCDIHKWKLWYDVNNNTDRYNWATESGGVLVNFYYDSNITKKSFIESSKIHTESDVLIFKNNSISPADSFTFIENYDGTTLGFEGTFDATEHPLYNYTEPQSFPLTVTLDQNGDNTAIINIYVGVGNHLQATINKSKPRNIYFPSERCFKSVFDCISSSAGFIYFISESEVDRIINDNGSGVDIMVFHPGIITSKDNSFIEKVDTISGRGVIYRMIDEFNNDIPYDFKNIQFKHPTNTSNDFYYYTFSYDGDFSKTDLSLGAGNKCYSNNIKPYINSSGAQEINRILFVGSNCYGNSFGNNCYDNSFMKQCLCNSFGNDCHSNSFMEQCIYNSFGNDCYSNSFMLGCTSNLFGNSCGSNEFGQSCNNNSIGNNCSGNAFGNNCSNNSFGNFCQANHFGTNCGVNSFGNECMFNEFGSYCQSNSFGNECHDIKFASDSDEPFTKYDYYQYNHFGDGCHYILFKQATTPGTTGGLTTYVQNYNFDQGIQGVEEAYKEVTGIRNDPQMTRVKIKGTDKITPI